jgi:prevent-host-death family protein
MTTISVAEAKRRFSRYLAESAYGKKRVVITKREVPVAALVSLEDLRELEQLEKRKGLAAVVGRWKGFEEMEKHVVKAVRQRRLGNGGRDVSL